MARNSSANSGCRKLRKWITWSERTSDVQSSTGILLALPEHSSPDPLQSHDCATQEKIIYAVGEVVFLQIAGQFQQAIETETAPSYSYNRRRSEEKKCQLRAAPNYRSID